MKITEESILEFIADIAQADNGYHLLKFTGLSVISSLEELTGAKELDEIAAAAKDAAKCSWAKI